MVISPYKAVYVHRKDVIKKNIPKCPFCGLYMWVDRKTKKLVCIGCDKVGIASPYGQR